jgi:hypothetical protein
VANPVFDTVAIEALLDCQLAVVDTFWVVPFDILAVAVNCTVCPTVTAFPPETDTLLRVTVGGAGGGVGGGGGGVTGLPLLPHAENANRTPSTKHCLNAAFMEIPSRWKTGFWSMW